MVKQIVWMVLGYLAAVVAATMMTVALVVAASTLQDNGRLGSYYRVMSSVPDLILFGLIMTSLYALPGWSISVVIAFSKSLVTKRYFVFSGVLTALMAHFVSAILRGGDHASLFGVSGATGAIVLWSAIGGAFGGWAYWLVAVRRFGKFPAIWPEPLKF